MKRNLSFLLIGVFFNTSFSGLKASFFDECKKRNLAFYASEEVSLSSEKNEILKNKMIAVALETHRDIWEHEPLKLRKLAEAWNLVLMRSKDLNSSNALLISKDIEGEKNPNYSILLRVSAGFLN